MWRFLGWKAEKVSADVTSIFDVLHKHENGEAHIDSKSRPETVHSASLKRDFIKSNLTVADLTAAITMSLWEDKIDQVKENEFYLFEKVRVSYYDKTRYSEVGSYASEQKSATLGSKQ